MLRYYWGIFSLYLDKPMLVRSSVSPGRRRGTGPSKGSAILVVAALAAVNYFLFLQPPDAAAPPPLEQRLNPTSSGAAGQPQLQLPAQHSAGSGATQAAPADGAAEQLPARDDFGAPIGRHVAGRLRRGQTVIKALEVEGIDNRTALPLIQSMRDVFDFRQARVGNKFEAWVDDEGQVRRFRYVNSPLDVYEVALQRDGSYVSKKIAVPTRVEVATVGCPIRSSLYASLRACGEGSQLVSMFIDLFAWDVDFFQDVRRGDELRVLVEKISVDGKFLKYGRILAADYRGKFGQHRLVRYTDPEGRSGYFTPEGRAARKDFLKSPLKYTTASAGTHSLLRGSLRKAGPLVYTAKAGTEVWSVADGRVVFAGESGSLGLTVTVQHDNGFTSTYGHLKRLGRGIKVGRTVNQKSLLGYVGSTGNTTSPQLLFSLRRNGKLVNPLRVTATEADPIPERFHDHFQGEARKLLDRLEHAPMMGAADGRS